MSLGCRESGNEGGRTHGPRYNSCVIIQKFCAPTHSHVPEQQIVGLDVDPCRTLYWRCSSGKYPIPVASALGLLTFRCKSLGGITERRKPESSPKMDSTSG